MPKLSKREREVLTWIRYGKSNSEMGMILGLSQFTVKNYVEKLLRKLGTPSRAGAVGKAFDKGILVPEIRQ